MSDKKRMELWDEKHHGASDGQQSSSADPPSFPSDHHLRDRFPKLHVQCCSRSTLTAPSGPVLREPSPSGLSPTEEGAVAPPPSIASIPVGGMLDVEASDDESPLATALLRRKAANQFCRRLPTMAAAFGRGDDLTLTQGGDTEDAFTRVRNPSYIMRKTQSEYFEDRTAEVEPRKPSPGERLMILERLRLPLEGDGAPPAPENGIEDEETADDSPLGKALVERKRHMHHHLGAATATQQAAPELTTVDQDGECPSPLGAALLQRKRSAQMARSTESVPLPFVPSIEYDDEDSSSRMGEALLQRKHTWQRARADTVPAGETIPDELEYHEEGDSSPLGTALLQRKRSARSRTHTDLPLEDTGDHMVHSHAPPAPVVPAAPAPERNVPPLPYQPSFEAVDRPTGVLGQELAARMLGQEPADALETAAAPPLPSDTSDEMPSVSQDDTSPFSKAQRRQLAQEGGEGELVVRQSVTDSSLGSFLLERKHEVQRHRDEPAPASDLHRRKTAHLLEEELREDNEDAFLNPEDTMVGRAVDRPRDTDYNIPFHPSIEHLERMRGSTVGTLPLAAAPAQKRLLSPEEHDEDDYDSTDAGDSPSVLGDALLLRKRENELSRLREQAEIDQQATQQEDSLLQPPEGGGDEEQSDDQSALGSFLLERKHERQLHRV
ncbi:unnamed protein product [Vitrella brassicaformis CCMP3155]|uniref:Uncharacterized protein n=3 Tax=Vitrella brassicaformis TaxID=1169539 RepID=A0A0G4GRW7_VITBC|nr:unnamed protein product [Vitrella brassicaformis CCMP3155]|eukprot:CEM33357.1 unnamed protein product [Vitrella brassicaformis CCMP3155]